MSFIIPQEVVDIVIDFCHADRRTLFACSLVCASWIPSTRHHLFGFVWLSNSQSQQRVDSFIDLLKWPTSSFVTESIVVLNLRSQYSSWFDDDTTEEINEDDKNDSHWLLSRLAPWFNRFSSVRQLGLLCLICASTSLQPLSSFTGITSLRINGLLFHDFTQFLELAMLFPELYRLSIWDMTFKHLQGDLLSPQIPPSLRELSIINCGYKRARRILQWLASCSPRPILQELKLDYPEQDNIRYTQEIINHSASSLCFLELSIFERYAGGFSALDLSACTELQVLNLRGYQKASVCHYVYEMVTSVRSNNVRRIVLPMIDRSELTDYTIPHWNALDELFANDMRFSNLRSVTVFDYSEDAIFTKTSLPLTSAKGIIEVEETASV